MKVRKIPITFTKQIEDALWKALLKRPDIPLADIRFLLVESSRNMYSTIGNTVRTFNNH